MEIEARGTALPSVRPTESPRGAAMAAPVTVQITDIEMPFWSMVVFMVKWVLASIPAFLILAAIAFVLATILGAPGMSLRSLTP